MLSGGVWSGDGGPDEETRRIRTLVLWTLPDGWMVSAWCEGRWAFRTFRPDRIAILEASGETFPPDGPMGLRAFLASEDCGA